MPGEFGGPSPEEQRIGPVEPVEKTSHEAGELYPEKREALEEGVAELEGNAAGIQKAETVLGNPAEYRSLVAQLGDGERQRLEATIAQHLEKLREQELSIQPAVATLNPKEVVIYLINSRGVERLSALLGYLSGGAQILGAAGLVSEVGGLIKTKHQLRRAEGRLREFEKY